MKRSVLYALAAVLCFSAFAPPAFAEDAHSLCRWVTASAVLFGNRVRQVHACRHLALDFPGRYATSFEQQWQLCMSRYGSSQNTVEQQARIADMQGCGAFK